MTVSATETVGGPPSRRSARRSRSGRSVRSPPAVASTGRPPGSRRRTGRRRPAAAARASSPRRALHPPRVTVTQPAADPALGDIFLTPVDGRLQAGRDDRQPRRPAGLVRARRRRARRRPTCASSSTSARRVLTYWQGRIVLGHGLGVGRHRQHELPADRHGRRRATASSMDLHDFDLEPGGVGADHGLRAGALEPQRRPRAAHGSSRTASCRRSTCGPGS